MVIYQTRSKLLLGLYQRASRSNRSEIANNFLLGKDLLPRKTENIIMNQKDGVKADVFNRGRELSIFALTFSRMIFFDRNNWWE